MDNIVKLFAYNQAELRDCSEPSVVEISVFRASLHGFSKEKIANTKYEEGISTGGRVTGPENSDVMRLTL